MCLHADRFLKEVLQIIDNSLENYDSSKITLEYRTPDSAPPYNSMLILNQPCFNVRGKKTQYLEMPPRIARLLFNAGLNLEEIKTREWFRMPAESFSFLHYPSIVENMYELCLQSNGFHCCSRYMACSNAQKCVHPDIMFAGQCTYRQRLKKGIIYFGENRTI